MTPLLALSAILLAASADDPKTGWRPLFDGKTLDGWEHVGPGKMLVEGGAIRTEGGMGLLWYTKEPLGDCVIRIVYKTASKASNSIRRQRAA